MQTITTPAGEVLAVLPMEEYAKLTEAADILAARKVSADIASGADELVPAAVVDSLLAGENPVRVWRLHRGLSARALAEAAGVSAAYVSEIETGKKDGSLSVMKRVAEALSVTLDDLT